MQPLFISSQQEVVDAVPPAATAAGSFCLQLLRIRDVHRVRPLQAHQGRTSRLERGRGGCPRPRRRRPEKHFDGGGGRRSDAAQRRHTRRGRIEERQNINRV